MSEPRVYSITITQKTSSLPRLRYETFSKELDKYLKVVDASPETLLDLTLDAYAGEIFRNLTEDEKHDPRRIFGHDTEAAEEKILGHMDRLVALHVHCTTLHLFSAVRRMPSLKRFTMSRRPMLPDNEMADLCLPVAPQLDELELFVVSTRCLRDFRWARAVPQYSQLRRATIRNMHRDDLIILHTLIPFSCPDFELALSFFDEPIAFDPEFFHRFPGLRLIASSSGPLGGVVSMMRTIKASNATAGMISATEFAVRDAGADTSADRRRRTVAMDRPILLDGPLRAEILTNVKFTGLSRLGIPVSMFNELRQRRMDPLQLQVLELQFDPGAPAIKSDGPPGRTLSLPMLKHLIFSCDTTVHPDAVQPVAWGGAALHWASTSLPVLFSRPGVLDYPRPLEKFSIIAGDVQHAYIDPTMDNVWEPVIGNRGQVNWTARDWEY